MIVAFCKSFGIGFDNKLPWSIPEDLAHFENITTNNIVVMGRSTFFSIPAKNRPLKNRLNIVVTSDPTKYNTLTTPNLVFCTMDEVVPFVKCQKSYDKCFIIGGERIFKYFLDKSIVVKLYATCIEKEYTCDRFFPMTGLSLTLTDVSKPMYSDKEQCNYRFLTYEKKATQHADVTYQSLLQDILIHGSKRGDRTGTGTTSVFGRQIKFDISDTVPLLTTKYVPWKMVVKELLWFLQGKTDSSILKADGVNIWNGNTTREFLDKRGLSDYEEGDIGPMYGFQWRHFGAEYKGCKADYGSMGIDQLSNVVDLLINDPFSRRILMTTVNVSDLEKGCLHPCHGIVVQFYVDEDEDKQKHLSCHMYQRSVDTFLGLTWNIFSYAVLTYIVAKKVGMLPKELTISTGDTHLYLDHIDQANTQVQRVPYPSPKLIISDDVANKCFENITIADFDLVGYFFHPAIKAKMSV